MIWFAWRRAAPWCVLSFLNLSDLTTPLLECRRRASRDDWFYTRLGVLDKSKCATTKSSTNPYLMIDLGEAQFVGRVSQRIHIHSKRHFLLLRWRLIFQQKGCSTVSKFAWVTTRVPVERTIHSAANSRPNRRDQRPFGVHPLPFPDAICHCILSAEEKRFPPAKLPPMRRAFQCTEIVRIWHWNNRQDNRRQVSGPESSHHQ